MMLRYTRSVTSQDSLNFGKPPLGYLISEGCSVLSGAESAPSASTASGSTPTPISALPTNTPHILLPHYESTTVVSLHRAVKTPNKLPCRYDTLMKHPTIRKSPRKNYDQRSSPQNGRDSGNHQNKDITNKPALQNRPRPVLLWDNLMFVRKWNPVRRHMYSI